MKPDPREEITMDGFENNQNQQNEQAQQPQQNPYQQNAYQDPGQGNYSAYGAPQDAQPPKANGLQIAGLVLGILSIVIGCCGWYGLIFSIAGIVCSVLGNKDNTSGVGKAGLICSIIGIVIAVLITILGIIGLSMLGKMGIDYNELMQQSMGS